MPPGLPCRVGSYAPPPSTIRKRRDRHPRKGGAHHGMPPQPRLLKAAAHGAADAYLSRCDPIRFSPRALPMHAHPLALEQHLAQRVARVFGLGAAERGHACMTLFGREKGAGGARPVPGQMWDNHIPGVGQSRTQSRTQSRCRVWTDPVPAVRWCRAWRLLCAKDQRPRSIGITYTP